MDSEKDFLESFICCYESHRSLWDVTSKEYLQRDKKEAGYQELLQIFQTIKSSATKDDVRKKINSLRSSYRRELKKTKESETSGAGTDHLYESTIWWFPLMSFLHHLEKPVSSITSMDDRDSMVSPEIVESEFGEDVRKNQKKKKTSKHDEMLSTAWSYLTQSEDTFDKMAKTWADKLRKMPKNQSLIAEKIINDTIFEGEMGFLSIDTIARNKYTGSSASSHSPFTILPPSPSPNSNSAFSSFQHASSSPNTSSTMRTSSSQNAASSTPVPNSPSPNSVPERITISPDIQTISTKSNFIINRQPKNHKFRLIASTSPKSPHPTIIKRNETNSLPHSPQLFEMSPDFILEEDQKNENLRAYIENFTYE